ncbi:hypothetical protein [Roseobacter fucihabitans]|nr:hypothetical protein [Roseobacter litoralis]
MSPPHGWMQSPMNTGEERGFGGFEGLRARAAFGQKKNVPSAIICAA